MKKSLLILTLTAGIGSMFAAEEAKPRPDTGLLGSEAVGKSAGEAVKSGIGSLFGSTAKSGAAAAVTAATGIPPLNLNLNINTDVTNCNTGDIVNNVTGSNNQVQNVITTTCNKVAGASGDVARFTLPSQKVTVTTVQDIEIYPNIAYEFVLANGKTASFAAVAGEPLYSASGITTPVTTYTQRTKGNRWSERFRFGVDNVIGTEFIAPMRVYPNGKAEIFFPNPVNYNNARRLDLDLLNLRMPV
jgi:hypothetical protein